MTTTLHTRPKCLALLIQSVLSSAGRVAACAVLSQCVVSVAHAGPAGGAIVGGSGSINTSDLTTSINQSSASLAINWNSFNLDQNDIVNFIQPSASSIVLNRILSSSGSQIHGHINANGQVILVNPNGIFFGATSSVNVGGLIASGLDINVDDFMNGNYLFHSVENTNGVIMNAGLLNASLGGSISLLGKQITNEGVIVANLGAVNLAAGHEAVVTFDDAGYVGIKVTKEILQNELGLDPAILNSGDITANGGRILLTASQSQDLFSQAVNTGSIKQATSLVMHEDGTFTLGRGANVVNSGTLDVSTTEINHNAGQVVVLGENITSSGHIIADAQNANGGVIELHAADTTALTDNSVTTVRAVNNGVGGVIKLLGNKVGLFNNSVVDASGANGGGAAYIGGDYRGNNPLLRNAEFVYLDEHTRVHADATDAGDGGTIIAWSDNATRVHGKLFARGGLYGGNGGFIETSGKQFLSVTQAVDVSALFGNGGKWLLDPRNITILNDCTATPTECINSGTSPFLPGADNSEIDVDIIATALLSGDVEINTGIPGIQVGNITFDATLNYNGTGSKTLTLNAANNIRFSGSSSILDVSTSTVDVLSLNLIAGGSVTLDAGASIVTRGGDFTVTNAASFTSSTGSLIDVSTGRGSLSAGGNVTITAAGDVNLGVIDLASSNENGGDILINSGGNITLNSALNIDWANDTSISLNADNNINIEAPIYDSDLGDLDIIYVILHADAENIGVGNPIGNGVGTVNINADIATRSGNFTATGAAFDSTGFAINTVNSSTTETGSTGNVALNINGVITLGSITTETTANNGNLTIQAGGIVTDAAGASLAIAGATSITASANNITLDNAGNDFGGAVSVVSANAVRLNDTTGMELGNINSASLNVTADDGITQAASTGLNVSGISTFAVSTNGADIFLNNPANALQGIISLSSTGTGGSNSNITLRNSYSLTTLGAISAPRGSVTVTADQNLTLGGNISAQGNVTLNGSASDNIFNFNSGVNITSAGVIAVNGNDGIDTFNIFTNILGTINGGNGNDIFNINAAGIQVSNIYGGSSTDDTGASDTLNGFNGINTWRITAANAGTLNTNTIFSGIENLNGGTGADTLVGLNSVTRWRITGNNQGNLANSSNTDYLGGGFTNFENLTGGTNTDAFTFGATGMLTGLITGGTGGSVDVVDLTALTSNITVELASSASTNLHITGVEQINANNANSNTLLGENLENLWTINASNSGELSNSSVTLDFTGFHNLTGGSGDDSFIFDGGSVGGVIDAGGHIDGDTVNYSNVTGTLVVDLANAFNGVLNAEGVVGNNTDSTLVGLNLNNAWRIIDNNDGDVTNTNGTVTFTDFNHLTGGTADDAFVFETDGSISGRIQGGNHIVGDTINYSALPSVAVFLDNLAPNSISGIETITGNNINSVLNGADINSVWNITGIDDGSVMSANGTVNFINFSTLLGGTANDTFYYYNGGSVSGQVSGGAGGGFDTVDGSFLTTAFDFELGALAGNLDQFERFIGNAANPLATGYITLVGADATENTWVINGTNSGTVNALEFLNFYHLSGGDDDDTFVFTDSGSIGGNINGGGQTLYDTLDYSGRTTVAVNLESLLSTVSGIERVVGNNTNSTLTSWNQNNIWTLSAANRGQVVAGTTMRFEQFNNLTGGSLTDVFNFNAGSSLSGLLDGSTGADTVNLTALLTDISVGVGSVVTADLNINNIEQLNANGARSNTLVGEDVTNTWTISASNTGTLNGIEFTNFSNLSGGSGTDIFYVNNNSSLNLVTGNAGSNTIYLNLSDVASGSLQYLGGANTDTVYFYSSPAIDASSIVYDAGMSGEYDRITYNYANANDYAVGYQNAENIFTLIGTPDFTVNGTAGDDNLVLSGSQFQVNNRSIVNRSGNVTGISMYGMAGNNDVLNIEGNVNITGDLLLSAETINNPNAMRLTAANLTLDGVTNAGSAVNRINTSVQSLLLNDVSGDVYLDEADQLTLAGLNNVTGAVDIVGHGNINSSAALISPAQLRLETDVGNIFLNLANQLDGELSLLAANGDVTLNNTSATLLDQVAAQNLDITSTGFITDTDNAFIQVNGVTSLSGLGITLDGANGSAQHQLGTLRADTAGNARFDVTSVNLDNITALSLTVNAIGDITDNDTSQITVSNQTALLSQTGDIALNGTDTHDFGSGNLTAQAAGDVVITATTSLHVDRVEAGGMVQLTSADSISDNGDAAADVIASRVELYAQTGINLDTQAATLNIINSTSGLVNIDNTGVVLLELIRNAGGDITFLNDQQVTIDRIEAAGHLDMAISNGDFRGEGSTPAYTEAEADIVAASGDFVAFRGSFGSLSRPIVAYIPGDITVFSRISFSPVFLPTDPLSRISDTSLLKFSALDTLSSLAGEQVVKVENLDDVDQAIFTNIQNYNMSDIAIRMPKDQLFEDEVE